ncbi:TAT-variant-translocated molybdopterin oxidoreductase [bacterium]|nr:TAT-variant-translocated molybdopterin oxidoreductase [bacterium]
MKSSNQYWKGIDELEQTPEFVESEGREFYEGLPLDKVFSNDDSFRANRRDFLKFFGFSVGAVALAACNKTPVKYAMPYAIHPDNVTPGVPLHYASSSISDYEGFPMLVKVREGRPIKFEPNKEAEFYGGGLDGLAHASILSLYDTNRTPGAQKKIETAYDSIEWAEADEAIMKGLSSAASSGKQIAVVSRSSTSLLLKSAVEKLNEKYGNVVHVNYEPVSYSGILHANEQSFGKKAIPAYHFGKADVIVSFGADFLGTWISPVRFSADWGKNRVPKNGKMSKHIQFESLMSLSGANADVRVPMTASSTGAHLVTLYNELLQLAGSSMVSGPKKELAGQAIKHAAEDLWKARGKSLVVSGSNDVNDQIIVNAINTLLGNYGTTIDMNNHFNGYSGDDSSFKKFTSDVNSGRVGAAIFVDANPSYSHKSFGSLLSKIPLTVSNALIMDETARSCTYLTPDLHALESWDIKEPYVGSYVFNQPTIGPVFQGRQIAESLMVWSGQSNSASGDKTYTYELTKSIFDSKIGGDFNKAIERGFLMSTASASPVSLGVSPADAASKIGARKTSETNLVLYQKVGVRDGYFANTPWAHEMPDPVTKVCWDNYLSISKPDADKAGLKDGDVAKVTANGVTLDSIPVLIQPGQARGTYGIALGYGRMLPESVQNDLKDLGQNVYPMVDHSGNTCNYVISEGVSVEKVEGAYELARTQSHHTIEGRNIVREASLDAYNEDPYVTNHHKHNLVSLWEEHDYSKGHHWAMAIDLNSCTGCSACIVSCSIENNVPIVGRTEIRRRREMHWIRIDRYYSFEVPQAATVHIDKIMGDAEVSEGDYLTEEKKINNYTEDTSDALYDNVKVVHQPMLCQHCDHAPCETVCPVLATTHSGEGLNQMTYNRCIGTKYCANNCPYKVRRFNWFRFNENKKFDYHFSNDLGKMVINPDVTVRSRGVMEKCSFCVQRIQSAKLQAKREDRKMESDEFTTACAQTCPSKAIVFGDLNDPKSEISKLYNNERSYHVIEELDTKPSIVYMTKIRNKKEKSNNHVAHH